MPVSVSNSPLYLSDSDIADIYQKQQNRVATAPTTSTGTGGYNVNPSPQAGYGAYGGVPGALGLPSPGEDLAAVYPNLSETNAEVSKNIMSQLRGELSPDTIAQIEDSAAAWGVRAGMPGAGIAFNRGLRDIGLQSEAVKQQGIQNFNAVTPTIKATQTVSPELQTEVSLQNAINAAAPNPTAAASAAQSLFNQYLSRLSNAGQTPTTPSIFNVQQPNIQSISGFNYSQR